MAEIEDQEEIAKLFIKNKKRLLHISYTYMVSFEAAEDLLGDAILAVLERKLSFESEESCLAYLKTVIRHKAINNLKRKYTMEPTETDQIDAAAYRMLHPNLPTKDVEARMALESLLTQYSAEIKEAFILYLLDDVPVSVLADKLNIKPASLRRQFSRMQERLRALPPEVKKQLLLMLFLHVHGML